MTFYTSDLRERSISRTNRPTFLSPDSAGHRALPLHVRGRGGCSPAHWALERLLSSLEKGFSVEAELAVLELALWLARRPSGIIWAPLPGWGHPVGGGGRGFTAHTRAKRSHFLTRLRAGSFCLEGLLLVPPVQYPTYRVCSSGLSATRNRCQTGVWNFPGRPQGLPAAKATVVGSGILSNHRSGKRKARPPFQLESAQVQAVP